MPLAQDYAGLHDPDGARYGPPATPFAAQSTLAPAGPKIAANHLTFAAPEASAGLGQQTADSRRLLAPEIAGTTTPQLRMFLAAYREGLNGNSPLYQALSFYKILEGATKFHTNRVRAARKRGEPAPADPMARQIPADPDGLAEVTVWSRDNFTPYLGKSFAEIREEVTDIIRNAVAHISPNMDLRIADYAADIQACRSITPVLLYVARDLIHEELASLSGANPSASSQAA